MNNINILLQQLSLIKMKYDKIEESEEKFNIFSVLHKEHDERRLHSRFISVMLSPKGSHQMGDDFLNLFLDTLKRNETLKINSECFANAEVYPTEANKTENNNIDILIIDRNSKNAVIIENKIYAGDSNSQDSGQLERYYSHILINERIPEDNISVLYLSLDGHEPSEKSIGNKYPKLKEKYRCISYKSEIKQWLDLVIMKTVSKPFLRESISQYLKLIKKMTNDISVEERLEIMRQIAISKENMQGAKLLVENFKHVKWHTVHSFWTELEHSLIHKGYTVTDRPKPKDIEYITHYDNYKKGFTSKKHGIYFTVLDGLDIYIWHTWDKYLYYGIAKSKIDLSIESDTKIKKIIEEDNNYQCSDRSHIWKEFDLPNEEKIWLADFSYEGTFNLIDDKYRELIIKKIIQEIDKFISKVN